MQHNVLKTRRVAPNRSTALRHCCSSSWGPQWLSHTFRHSSKSSLDTPRRCSSSSSWLVMGMKFAGPSMPTNMGSSSGASSSITYKQAGTYRFYHHLLLQDTHSNGKGFHLIRAAPV
eukprot:1065396-Pelagomonas_calceolata.AAC.1